MEVNSVTGCQSYHVQIFYSFLIITQLSFVAPARPYILSTYSSTTSSTSTCFFKMHVAHRLKEWRLTYNHSSSFFQAMAATRNNSKRPSPESRVENAARRVRMKKCLEKAQQEEAFRELLWVPMGAKFLMVQSISWWKHTIAMVIKLLLEIT